MIFAHVAGELIRDPAAKTSASGKPYALLLVRVGSGETSLVVSALVFGDLVEAALALEKGDIVSVYGRASLSVYQREGHATVSASVFVSKLLSGRPDPKRKAARAEPQAQPERAEEPGNEGREPAKVCGAGRFDDMADDIPF